MIQEKIFFSTYMEIVVFACFAQNQFILLFMQHFHHCIVKYIMLNRTFYFHYINIVIQQKK